MAAFLDAPRWYVGFSGGIDSTVLLHLVWHWRQAHPQSPPLAAIHVNHGLSPAAPRWQDHCEAYCGSLSLPLLAREVDVGQHGRGESAARAARYSVFEELLPPGGVLFLAHHLDDQVETFFLRLLRGAGVEGLAAMPRSRVLGRGRLLRPLLDYSRESIEGYARHHGLPFVEDASNSDTALDRNYLRAALLPVLGGRWPGFRQSIARSIGHMEAAAVAIAEGAGAPRTVYSAMGDPGMPLAWLQSAPLDVAAARMRAWLRERGQRMPDRAALTEFLRQLAHAAATATPRLDSGSYVLQRYREAVYLLPDFAAPVPAAPLLLAPGVSHELPGAGGLTLCPGRDSGLWLDEGEEVTVNWRAGGEVCRLPGRGGRRRLKSLLQELGVPPWWRERLPLLFVRDELVAVGDILRCDSPRWRDAPSDTETLWELRWLRPAGRGSD